MQNSSSKWRTITDVGLLLALLLTACNVPMGTSEPLATDRPTRLPTNTPRPSLTPPPTSIPLPAEQVWFAPNMGSTDYTDLFAHPGNWVQARSNVDVFKFYNQNVLDIECDICGDNTLPAFRSVDAFRQLETWGVATAVEVGAVKEWGCTGDQEFRNADAAVRNIEANGGRVAILAMDEPLLGGQHEVGGVSCGYDVEQIGAATANFMNQVATAHPSVVVGDIEPYPIFSVEYLEAWIVELERQGVKPAFFHLDVDLERLRVEGQDVEADLVELDRFMESRDIAFGVILTSNWRQAGSNRAYYQSTMRWAERVAAAVGRPSHLIFQSWQGPAPSGAHEIPSNLTETDEFSHTRLILDGLPIFAGE